MTAMLSLILLLLPLSALAQDAPRVVEGQTDRSTPRRAVWSFLWWLQEKPGQWKPELAAQCLDLSHEEGLDGQSLAIRLKRWLDVKGLFINPQTIPDEPGYEHSTEKEAKFWLSEDEAYRKLYLVRVGEHWLFSSETVAAIPSWYSQEFPWIVDLVFDRLPKSFRWEIPGLGIRLWQAAGIGILFLLAMVVSRIARWIVKGPTKRLFVASGHAWADRLLPEIARPAGSLAGLGLFATLFPMLLIVQWNQISGKIFAPLAVVLFVWMAWRCGEFLGDEMKRRAQKTETQTDDHLVPFVRVGARVVIVTLGAVFILQSLGFEVGTLVAGLGIGGLAVALALQSVLGDLFASITIALDKPFLVGDFIIFGDFMGTVEQVGLKTTRIRSLSGEQLVMANADLVKSTLRNFKRMNERRIVFGFGVVYQTSPEKIEAIPSMVREMIESKPGTRFDRGHFKRFADSSLDFEFVYWVLSAEFNKFMDVQQQINLDIVKRFAAEGISFAYPTQTVFLEKLGDSGAKS